MKTQKHEKKLDFRRERNLLEIVHKESSQFSESMDIISKIAKKHNLTFLQVVDLLEKSHFYIPLGIFRCKLSPLETLVRYLKDYLDFSYAKIARCLNRDETTIWTTYNNSLSKGNVIVHPIRNLKRNQSVVPFAIFSERKLSILESLCLYLRESLKISYHDIGEIIDRNERTVWTVVNRARKKLNE